MIGFIRPEVLMIEPRPIIIQEHRLLFIIIKNMVKGN